MIACITARRKKGGTKQKTVSQKAQRESFDGEHIGVGLELADGRQLTG